MILLACFFLILISFNLLAWAEIRYQILKRRHEFFLHELDKGLDTMSCTHRKLSSRRR